MSSLWPPHFIIISFVGFWVHNLLLMGFMG